MDQSKKISFGFSKLAKKPAIVSSHVNINKQDDVNKVEFIDCLEGKSIKLKDPISKDQGPLIIPLTRAKEEKSSNHQVNSKIQDGEGRPIFKSLQNKVTNESSETDNEQRNKINTVDETNKSESQNKQETLDELAAREILEELNRKKTEDEENRVFSVPLTSNAPTGEKESTLEDYESVPVGEFGMAMLRGMGWAPGKGIGKTEKLVAPTLPTPRPKGMGLGADKVIKSVEKKGLSEDLKMIKGSFIRILAGPEKDSYGQIEGFDDESGRLIVKLALKNVSISLNEFMVQLVDANEFKKNSKVINVSKYEKYKEDEVKKEFGGQRLQEEVHENAGDKEPLLNTIKAEKIDDKYNARKKHYSRSSDSDIESVKDNSLIKSRSARYHSPADENRIDERSHSQGHNYESTKLNTSKSSLKYHDKGSTSSGRKPRSYSSDSSDSSSHKHSKTKPNSPKTKKSMKDGRLVSQHRSSSNSSFTSSSSGNYSRKKKNKHKKKKSSSSKYSSRSRSRSPRKHKHKKHKKHC